MMPPIAPPPLWLSTTPAVWRRLQTGWAMVAFGYSNAVVARRIFLHHRVSYPRDTLERALCEYCGKRFKLQGVEDPVTILGGT